MKDMFEIMYDRIKRMTFEEMKTFIYWVYMMGNLDGQNNAEDSPDSYFGGYMLGLESSEVIPDDDVKNLWKYHKEAQEKYEKGE